MECTPLKNTENSSIIKSSKKLINNKDEIRAAKENHDGVTFEPTRGLVHCMINDVAELEDAGKLKSSIGHKILERRSKKSSRSYFEKLDECKASCQDSMIKTDIGLTDENKIKGKENNKNNKEKVDESSEKIDDKLSEHGKNNKDVAKECNLVDFYK